MSIHDGHRQRMRRQLLGTGLDSFEDYQVLELLLFYAIPRADVNAIAHRLLNRFGTLSGVFDAPFEELMRVEGVGENTASLIKFMPQLARRYLLSRDDSGLILNSTVKAGAYITPRFVGERNEVVYIICLDSRCKVIHTEKIFEGDVNSANVNMRRIVETALLYNSVNVILAHNHTSGISVASAEDEETTAGIYKILSQVGITLIDHLIVANNNFTSMADSGFFEKL